MEMEYDAIIPPAKIKVIGVGGGGSNAVQNCSDCKHSSPSEGVETQRLMPDSRRAANRTGVSFSAARSTV